MDNKKENFFFLLILGTVAFVATIIILNNLNINSNINNVGMAYYSDGYTIELVTGEEYIVNGRQIALQYLDGQTTVLEIDGVLVKIPNGEKVNYKGLTLFSYGGEKIGEKAYLATIDFYNRYR
ncbi:MAG: hypothetical protein KatS3mg002_0745 [Candidatus Woesearchaeota archaeon]|nr:MAG: hypothetical protein KatS3mg002_0745 [Candidatus Woesearchaeota archaeon]